MKREQARPRQVPIHWADRQRLSYRLSRSLVNPLATNVASADLIIAALAPGAETRQDSPTVR